MTPTATSVLIWALVVFGVTNVVTQSKLFGPVRHGLDRISAWLGDLIHCPMCFGWWVGALGSYCLGLGVAPGPRLQAAICDGFAASGVCWVLHMVVEALSRVNQPEAGPSEKS